MLPAAVPCGVQDGPPEPGIETSLAAPLAPAAERRDERVLDGVLGPLAIVQDRVRDAAELVEPAQVDHLDLAHGRAIREPLTSISYLANLLYE